MKTAETLEENIFFKELFTAAIHFVNISLPSKYFYFFK